MLNLIIKAKYARFQFLSDSIVCGLVRQHYVPLMFLNHFLHIATMKVLLDILHSNEKESQYLNH